MSNTHMTANIYDVADNNIDNEIPLAKLHLMANVLMTKFHYHKCPKMAHFIVKHLSLILANPEINNDSNSRTIYLQLLNQWQHITMTLMEQNRQQSETEQTIH